VLRVYCKKYTKGDTKITTDSNFEVRHPRCVNQITYMVDVQSKHNYLIC